LASQAVTIASHSVRALFHLGRASDALLNEFQGEILPFVALRAFVRALLVRSNAAHELR
jgi:hypothetical protein